MTLLNVELMRSAGFYFSIKFELIDTFKHLASPHSMSRNFKLSKLDPASLPCGRAH